MHEDLKKVLLQREAEVDKGFREFGFQRNLLGKYWDEIDHKKD